MVDIERSIEILVQAVSFIAAFAALAAAVIMFQVKKKFGSGILASGFSSIAIGVLLLAIGIIIDSINIYIQFSDSRIYHASIIVVKGLFFVIGTYTIVIGSKKTADKLENLTR